ncbi:hypothetical protein GCM10029992_35410 [Glycomyces albus]
MAHHRAGRAGAHAGPEPPLQHRLRDRGPRQRDHVRIRRRLRLPTYREYKYSFAMEDLVFEAVVIDGPIDGEAREVLEGLTDELYGLYLELA